MTQCTEMTEKNVSYFPRKSKNKTANKIKKTMMHWNNNCEEYWKFFFQNPLFLNNVLKEPFARFLIIILFAQKEKKK